MKKFFILGAGAALLLLCGCGRSSDAVSDYEYRIAPLEYEFGSVEDMEKIVDTIIVVEPEVTDLSLLTNIAKLRVTPEGGFIVLDKNGVYHFSRDGSFIRQYGMKGRGPAEYIELTDIGLDSDSGCVYLLDALNKVLVFDTTTGELKKSVVPDRGGRVFGLDNIIPKSGDDGFYVYSANTNTTKSKELYYGLYEFDADAKNIAEYLPGKDFIIGIGAVSYGYGDKYLVRPLDSRNIVTEVADGQVRPFLWVDFGDKNAPEGSIYNDAGEQDLPYYFNSNYYKNPFNFQQTGEYVSFAYAGPHYEAEGVIYSKKAGTGVRFQAPDKKTIPFVFLASDGEYMYGIVDKYSGEGMQERADPLTRYIIRETGFADMETNPRIVGVRFGTMNAR